jgi:hypothetical protein
MSGFTREVWQLRQSTLRLDWPRAGIVGITIEGYGHLEFANPCTQRLEEALRATERLTVLADFGEMSGYDSGYRIALTDWVAKRRPRLDAVHVLSRARLVNMGVAVANLALGGMLTTYTERSRYDRAIRDLGRSPPRST